MESLVDRLSKGKYKIIFESRTTDFKELKERVENGFVFVKFTETRGGTELGINLVKDECDLSKVDFNKGVGKIKIMGRCELNYQKIKCFAEVDIKTKEGNGYIEIVE